MMVMMNFISNKVN